ncbi:uncharacterized protein F5Z01DRAFT_677884 [Emericellopsis atlantica]|uniref:Uncharacterized protein n=1 Tax=Emericellopsis atlantica TaxID=2614577 RepID=A0A9P7ZF38_9HYPO|nr:uncharacterized protein F5Z01DRAFT_677884 [Emericellopsis atlantica]KAG9250323.1 hypothetical protein F5Z01DRAFT_677884 [Emericellopsis atlantica]
MHYSTLSKTLQLAFVLSTQAISLPVQGNEVALPEGYTESPLVWELQSHPDGETFSMEGTVEQVHQELTRRNPNYLADFGIELDERDDDSNDALVTRDTCHSEWHSIVCGWDSPIAETKAIRAGISYLRGVPGKPHLGAGPGNCSRVSCSYSSAIYWCNDRNKAWSLGSFNSIAKGAQCIYNDCQANAKVKGEASARGSAWRVIIAHANC